MQGLTAAYVQAGGAKIDTQAFDITIAQALLNGGGGGGLTKDGSGTLALSGASTYTGTTTVNNGTLRVNSPGSLAAGSTVTVSGGTLGGTGTINGPVNVLGATLAPGASAGTLTINNSLALADGSILEFELNGTNTTVGGGINDLINGVTGLTLDGTLNIIAAPLGSFDSVTGSEKWRLFDYTGALTDSGLVIGTHPTLPGTLTFSIDTSTAGQVNLVVPEPATLAFVVLGGVGLLARRRR